MRRCCTSCVVREMHRKTGRLHAHPREPLASRARTPAGAGGPARQEAHPLWLGMQAGQPLRETAWRFLTEPDALSPCHPAVVPPPAPRIYPEGLNTHIHTHTKACTRCLQVFTAASSCPQNWEGTRRPSGGEGWISCGPSRRWTVNSGLKGNELPGQAKRGGNRNACS